jgi:RimJ/RimL family protein N-acetyltransferase
VKDGVSGRAAMHLTKATGKDFQEVLRMAHAFHEESPYSDVLFDENVANESFDLILRKPNESIIILARDVTKTVGMIIGAVAPLFFSKDVATTEIAWWLDKEYRGRKIAIQMLQAFEIWSKEIIGAKLCQVSCLDEKIERMLTKLKYTKCERHMVKWL